MKSGSWQIYLHPLLILALLLTVCGLTNLFSATLSLERDQLSVFFTSQGAYTALGLLVMFVVSRLPYRWLYGGAYVLFGLCLALLVVVLILGTERHGAQSWLTLGPVRLQPSEIGKLGLIVALSRYLSDLKRDASLTLGELLVPVGLFGLSAGLVILQNDLGSSLFYGLILASLLLLQGVQWRWIALGLVLALILSVVSYKFILKPYQKNRIVAFMNPELDPRGSGYHLVQSKIAVGSGGLVGKGYTKGQSHRLKFLPERHTDFVFPVLLEEWGFMGGVFCLLLYLLFLFSGLNAASQCDTRFGFFVSFGVVAYFFWHVVINLGGVLGLMPLTGVPLPFFSYGGSSLVANWVAIGLWFLMLRAKS